MSSYALVPGAGGAAWYWSRVAPLLEAAGHTAIAVDLPADDESAGLGDYADLVCAAVEAGHGDAETVLVVQSLGGFTAPLVASRIPLRTVVFVNAMIPLPNERVGAWWDATGSSAARIAAAQRGGYSPDFDLDTYFLHDVEPAVAAEGEPYQRQQSDAIFACACHFDAWPDVPIRVVAGAEDRFFPADFQGRVARERLGVETDLLPGGHLIALSQPAALTEYLLGV